VARFRKKQTKNLKIPLIEGTGSKAVSSLSTYYLKILFFRSFHKTFRMRFVCGYDGCLLVEIHDTRKCTLWARNDYFLISKQLVYIVTRVLCGKALRCASLTLQAMYPSAHKRHEIAGSVCLGAHPYNICKYQFYATVSRRRGAKACMKTLQMNSSNENVLHVSLWKRNCSLWSGQTKREMEMCEDL